MEVLGFRCSNSDYAYCVLTGVKSNPVIHEQSIVRYPKGFSEAETLQWLYQELQAVFRRNSIDALSIKKAEGIVKRSNALEARIKGGAIVSLVSVQSGCAAVSEKMNSTIAKDLGLKGKSKYLQTQLDTSVINGFDDYPAKIQEAILTAWSCM